METFNSKRFRAVYTRKLTEAMEAHPTEYRFPKDQIPKVVDKMVTGLAKGEANKEGFAIRNTCRELGIAYTYTAISAYLTGDFKIHQMSRDIWALSGPDGKEYIKEESYSVVSGVLESIREGATGHSEFDEVASQILDSVK